MGKYRFADDGSDNRWCNCLAVHDFTLKDIKWKEIIEYMLSIFAQYGTEPTRLSVGGGIYSRSVKSMTYRSGYRKIQKYGYDDIETFQLTKMNDKDDWVTNFIISTSLYSSADKTFGVICIDEQLSPLDSMLPIVAKLHELTKAKYGYCYKRHLGKQPEIYCIGGAGLYVNEEDYRKCLIWQKKAWLQNDNSHVRNKLRDIYRYNFLSDEHLNQSIKSNNILQKWLKGEQTLESWIKINKSHGNLSLLNDNFYCWEVEEDQIVSVREALIPSDIIVCI